MTFAPRTRLRLRRTCAGALVGGTLVLALLAPLAQAAPTSYEATFAVQDAGVWGAGAGGSVDKRSGLIDLTWDESDSVSDVKTIDAGLFDIDFGGGISGSTSGGLGLDFEYDVQGGKLDVTYPARVDVTYPAPASFYPGDTITVATSQIDRAGRAFNYDAGEQDLKLNGYLGVKADVDAKICVFSCSGVFALVPNFNLAREEYTFFDEHADPEFYGVIYDSSQDEVAEYLGIEALVQSAKPDASLDESTMSLMRATGQQSYLNANFDVDSMSKYPWGQSTPKSFSGGNASYDIIDGKIYLTADQGHDFEFKPVVKVTFALPQALAWTEKTPAGATVASGTSNNPRITAGNKLEITIPKTLTDPFSIAPTLSIDNTMRHKFEHVYQTRGELKVLQAKAGIPRTVIVPGTPELCEDTVIFGVVCLPRIPEFAVGPWELSLGPVHSEDIPIATVRPVLFDQTWTMTGFASYPQAATTLDPENIPVAGAGGPYTVAEGSSIQLDASASFDLDVEPLTYAWRLDKAGTLEATGVRPRFEGLDGGATYTATVRVCDASQDCSEASAQVTVTNVAPDLTLDETRVVDFGGGRAFLERVGVSSTYGASATDPGTDDTTYVFSAGPTSTWIGSRVVRFNNGATPDPAFSPFGVHPFNTAATSSVTFAQPGVFEVRVDATDDEAGTDAVTAAVLIADNGTTRRSIGWFKQQYSLQGNRVLTQTQLDGYLAFTRAGSRVFEELTPLQGTAQASAALAPPNTARQLCTADLLAAWLNVASGAVPYGSTLAAKQQTTTRRTVADALREIETVLRTPGATDAQLNAARQLAVALS
ncbi:MAG: repeat protein [Thermoleophilia bacterium]|nr:repeat protein [Thermoleophilia bacterium]